MPSQLTYLKELRASPFSEEYKQSVTRHAQPLLKVDLPIILSLKHLCVLTNTPYNEMFSLINRVSDNAYRVFKIKKRNGGGRWITVPNFHLMKIQRWINQHILMNEHCLQKISKAATAYIPATSAKDNANMHWKNNVEELIKTDITSFFESISERQVYHVFYQLGYKPVISFYLSRLCTRVLPIAYDVRYKKSKRWSSTKLKTYKYFSLNSPIRIGHLPQGAPTSPMLSNLVCSDLDSILEHLANQEQLIYTRYADDIILSGSFESKSKAKSILRNVTAELRKYGFKSNQQKTGYYSKGDKKIVTGICINDGGSLRVAKCFKESLRQEVYYINKYGFLNHCEKTKQSNPLGYYLSLRGRLYYLKYIENSGSAQRLLDSFNMATKNITTIIENLKL